MFTKEFKGWGCFPFSQTFRFTIPETFRPKWKGIFCPGGGLCLRFQTRGLIGSSNRLRRYGAQHNKMERKGNFRQDGPSRKTGVPSQVFLLFRKISGISVHAIYILSSSVLIESNILATRKVPKEPLASSSGFKRNMLPVLLTTLRVFGQLRQ